MLDRIDMGFYKGLNNADFIPMTVESETHDMQIAGMNTYTGTTDQNLGNCIDFISRDCYSQTVKWNITDGNNGTAETPHPYLASNVKLQLLDKLYEKLPADVKKVITPKRFLLEIRYSASGALKDSTGWGWVDLGKLWLPSEYEVFGSVVRGTKGWSAGQTVQYPIFANSWKNRIKGAGANGERCTWWLLTVEEDSSTRVCVVNNHGLSDYGYPSKAYRVPFCFQLRRQAQS